MMMDVEGRPRVVHTVSSYIDYSKDKQGFTQVLSQFSMHHIILQIVLPLVSSYIDYSKDKQRVHTGSGFQFSR